MQQTGCLKKRRKRNIAKVSGLGLVAYDESEDTFTGRDMYRPAQQLNAVFKLVQRTKDDTRINLSSGSASRVTRDPTFDLSQGKDQVTGQGQGHLIDDPDEDEIEMKGGAFDFDDEENTHSPNAGHTRPYFFSPKSMLRLRQLLILGMTSGLFPWVWNKKDTCVDKFSPKRERWWYAFWTVNTIQTTFLTGFQAYSFFARQTPTPEGEEKSYREVFMMTFSFFWYACAVIFNINMYYYKDYIRQYINSLLFMNKKFTDLYVISSEGYNDSGQILIDVSIPTNITQVFISVSLFLRLPWQPWFLYSYIYKPSNPWYWLIPGALQEFSLVGQVITSYMLISWIIVAHTNSVSFWLKETHNHNDTPYTIEKIRNPHHALRIYRGLQILCQVFNDCMSPLAIPMVKVHIWAGIIPTGYVLIRSMNQKAIDEFPGILTYPFAVIDCVTGGFAILAVAAEMHDLGVSFIDSWGRTKQKDFRRILMSCPSLKVKVGRFYAITISTTITFFKSVIDYIIDCIITFP